MKLGKILTTVGSAILSTLIPGSGAIIAGVNALLPKDKRLPDSATGTQVIQAVNTLSPEQQATVLVKEYDVEIAEINSWTQVQGSLAEVDKAGASTRPDIAMMMAKVVAFVIIGFSTMWMIAIYQNPTEMFESLPASWPLMLAINATPTALLRAYFGMRSKDKEKRYSAAAGQPVKTNFIADIIKMIKK